MTTNSADCRIAWVDAAKGIGIILVVLGHIWLIGLGYTYINSFHVPLFFFLSGYVANFENMGFRLFIAKKFRSIVIPYFWLSLLTYGYWFLIERKISGNPIDPQFAFINIFLSPGADQYMPHNPAIWFLTCLFVVSIMFYPIAHVQGSVRKFVILLFSSVVGYAYSLFLPGYIPWSVDVALTGVVFYGMGFLLKNSKIVGVKFSGLRFLVLCGSIGAGFIISQLNRPVAMAQNIYGNYIYFYAAAALGILGVIILSMFLSKSKVLAILGRNSLVIFALHFPVKRLVVSITGKVLHISPDQIKGSFLLSSVDTIITILVLLPAIYIIHNYFPFVLGRSYSSRFSRLPGDIKETT